MAAPPASTKTSLQQRLSARARERWPDLAGIDVKFRGEFAYVTGRLPDGDTQPLMRFRAGRSAPPWGVAHDVARHNAFQHATLSPRPPATGAASAGCRSHWPRIRRTSRSSP